MRGVDPKDTTYRVSEVSEPVWPVAAEPEGLAFCKVSLVTVNCEAEAPFKYKARFFTGMSIGAFAGVPALHDCNEIHFQDRPIPRRQQVFLDAIPPEAKILALADLKGKLSR